MTQGVLVRSTRARSFSSQLSCCAPMVDLQRSAGLSPSPGAPWRYPVHHMGWLCLRRKSSVTAACRELPGKLLCIDKQSAQLLYASYGLGRHAQCRIQSLMEAGHASRQPVQAPMPQVCRRHCAERLDLAAAQVGMTAGDAMMTHWG